MSTLIASNLQASGNTGTAALLASINGGPISGARNRIINGDMRIDQRWAGASVSLPAGTSQVFVTDRWWVQRFGGTAAFSGQRSAVAPAGFNNSLLITTTTAASPSSGDTSFLAQRIEGFNIADLGWGSASAQAVTLSFWVRSSLSGTFSGSLNASGSARSYAFTYAISAANTWEYKTVSIPGDTAGTWLADNGWGIQICLDLGCGTTPRTSAGSWSSGQFNGVTGSTNLVGTNGATFYITGVQLEAGTVATPFERRSFGQELSLCQRYYISTSANTFIFPVNNQYQSVQFPVQMRSVPTVTVTTTGTVSGLAASTSGFYATNTSGPQSASYTAAIEL